MTAQHHHRKRTLSSLVLAVLLLAGCGDDIIQPKLPAIQGVVVDEESHTYPGVTVALRRAGSTDDLRSETTSIRGSYEFANIAVGSYEVAIELPLESEVVGTNPAAVTVEGTNTQADFTIRPLPVEGRVVYGEGGVNDSRNEIRNASGGKPESPGEPLYHTNEPEELHPITAPDGHHVTLGEWRQASGTGRATCNGSSGTRYTVSLDELIPNGVYSIGAVLVDFTTKPERIGTGELGVFTASASGEGLLEATLSPGPMTLNGSAPECVLTQVSEAKLWVIYHIDGQRALGPARSWMEHMSFTF